ncbi:DUF7112 family protein [Halomarina litorea]|uniref:DUF7112 family protein n=1 Tax=Halomarina litorea TaxID=2961595 RepID=UPI0020C23120|nr:hypothetical protein [Halomarina sp. BCD28]
MSDRIPHDHSSVSTHRATLARAGRTDRPKIVLPEDLSVPEGPVRIVLDGRTYHTLVDVDFDGVPEVRGVYENARMAREREGSSHLAEWVEERNLEFGRSVHVDVVEADLLGVRAPGETAVYTASPGPDDSLADIARNLDE